MENFTIVIADDHPMMRKAVRRIIEDSVEMELIGEANNGIELLELVKSKKPDLAIIDLEMPLKNGYETISELTSAFPDIKTIAFSGFLNANNQQHAIKMGADATVSKTDPCENLIKALHTVMQGKNYHSSVNGCFFIPPLQDQDDSMLTLREKQILALIAQGKTSKQISGTYNISQWTVDKHRSNIREKMGFRNLAEMVRYALDSRYIE